MGRKKPRKRRKGRAPEQCITRRGLYICQKGGQIKTMAWNRWDVNSECGGVWYRVSFAGESLMCECAYCTTGKECRCKHIAAVEQELLISSEAALYKKVDVNEHELKCPDCKEKSIPESDGTQASSRRCRGTSASYAGGGSGTT